MGNDKFVQMKGPFSANEDIATRIRREYFPDMLYLQRCGIQAKTGHKCHINGITFEIGKTGILQLNDVEITSLFFEVDEPASAIIDAVIE